LSNVPEQYKDLNIKAVMPVHLYGQSCDMETIMSLAEKYGLKIIEDAAQAIGAEYMFNGEPKRMGAMGDVGCFSFFPSKNLGGFGDGGMVVTNDSALAEKLVMLRNHGSEPKYYHALVGGNFRLDALQAVVLDIKLKRLESWHAQRRANAAYYDKGFEGTDVNTPQAVYADSGAANYHIYNQYVVRVNNRDAVRQKAMDAGIGTEIYYPVPLHIQECFADLGYKKGDMPESEKAADETIALPIYPELTEEMQDYVIKVISE
ncbi:transcriptional regulator, partial [bacterium E08(2017)]